MSDFIEAGRRARETAAEGWDSEGGVPIGPVIWFAAMQLAKTIRDMTGAGTHLTPCGDGTVHVSWVTRHNDARIYCEVHPTGFSWAVQARGPQ